MRITPDHDSRAATPLPTLAPLTRFARTLHWRRQRGIRLLSPVSSLIILLALPNSSSHRRIVRVLPPLHFFPFFSFPFLSFPLRLFSPYRLTPRQWRHDEQRRPRVDRRAHAHGGYPRVVSPMDLEIFKLIVRVVTWETCKMQKFPLIARFIIFIVFSFFPLSIIFFNCIQHEK